MEKINCVLTGHSYSIRRETPEYAVLLCGKCGDYLYKRLRDS